MEGVKKFVGVGDEPFVVKIGWQTGKYSPDTLGISKAFDKAVIIKAANPGQFVIIEFEPGVYDFHNHALTLPDSVIISAMNCLFVNTSLKGKVSIGTIPSLDSLLYVKGGANITGGLKVAKVSISDGYPFIISSKNPTGFDYGMNIIMSNNNSPNLQYTSGIDGSHNVFIGANVCANVVKANSNVMIGFTAGQSNKNGNGNTVIGSGAGQSIGVNSDILYEGFNNTYIGNNSGNMNSRGNNNVFVGAMTGFDTSVQSQWSKYDTSMVFIGYGATRDADTYSAIGNGIAIGSGAIVTASNNVVLGNDAITDTYLKGTVHVGGSLKVATVTDINASINSFFVGSEHSNHACYKDGSGVVHDLGF